MSARVIGRLAPGGSAISTSALLRACRPGSEPLRTLRAGLQQLLGASRLTFHASGRESLRALFAELARASGRDEVWMPAYACFSIPAAAVAAGCRVRLLDVTLRGQIDPAGLERLPVERAAALVVGNLLGVAEPTEHLRETASRHRVCLVDDAAQSLGAHSREGGAGARGDVGMLSFGRGKPLSALGGGALAFFAGGDSLADALEVAAPARAKRWIAACRALAYDIARWPPAFAALAMIPRLGIGQTRFDPGFARGGIDAASLRLAAAQIGDLTSANAARAKIAESFGLHVVAETRFVPLLAGGAGAAGVYPRVGLVAPDRRAREAALDQLAALGASALYPTPIGDIGALQAHLVGERECPGARAFCERLLTLPTHAGFSTARQQRAIAVLRGVTRAPGSGRVESSGYSDRSASTPR